MDSNRSRRPCLLGGERKYETQRFQMWSTDDSGSGINPRAHPGKSDFMLVRPFQSPLKGDTDRRNVLI